MKNVITYLTIVVLLFIVFNLLSKNKVQEKELIEVNGEMLELLSREVEIETKEIEIEIHIPGDTIYVETIIPEVQYIPVEVDTVEILKEFFAVRVYTDTLQIDTLGFVSVVDTISENRIISRYYSANFEERRIVETLVVREPPRLEIWTGVGASTNSMVYGSVGITTPSRNHIGIDLGIYQQDSKLAPFLGVRYLWQIR